MKSIKHHPGKLIVIWNDLPVTGKAIETGEWLTFPYGHILWEMEGAIDGSVPVYFLEEGVSKEIYIHAKSMHLVFSEAPENMTPIQKLALSALPLSHWKPEKGL